MHILLEDLVWNRYFRTTWMEILEDISPEELHGNEYYEKVNKLSHKCKK